MQPPVQPALEPTCASYRAAPAAPARLGRASTGDCLGASLCLPQGRAECFKWAWPVQVAASLPALEQYQMRQRASAGQDS